jgi:hypothetical protein
VENKKYLYKEGLLINMDLFEGAHIRNVDNDTYIFIKFYESQIYEKEELYIAKGIIEMLAYFIHGKNVVFNYEKEKLYLVEKFENLCENKIEEKL